MIYACCDQLRRTAVAAHPLLNGIDYLEVLDRDAPAGSPRQRTLLLRLLKPVPAGLDGNNVRLDGGERVRRLRVEWAAAAALPPAEATPAEQSFFATLTAPDHVLVVRTDIYGDFSTYRLRLARSASDDSPPVDFDPRLTEVEFSFKAECPSDFDCRPVRLCPDEPRPPAENDYLAKDYASFRRLLLDRLSQQVPGWRERSAADLGVTLAELLAYVGDQLSYWQDAVATEAYLATARRRISLRRHALLVDYHLHDGCNARAWVQVPVTGNAILLDRAGTRFYTRLPGVAPRLTPGSREDNDALRQSPVVFEPLHDATLFEAHNELTFYTWGDRRCCLPRGATSATLRGHLPELAVHMALLFEEVKGAATGAAEDADPKHRHVVRLTRVRAFDNGAPLTDPLTATSITEITWASEDALSFPLCLSAVTDRDHGEQFIEDISVARGNLVLADHGLTLAAEETLGVVPPPRLYYPPDRDTDHCAGTEPVPLPPRFRPGLAQAPLAQAGTIVKITVQGGSSRSERLPFDPEAAASQAMLWRMDDVVPAIRLRGEQPTTVGLVSEDWQPRRDLLNSAADAADFVVEVEHDGAAQLRCGDDHRGKRPDSGTVFKASYRVGNGRAGNIGADAIAHVVAIDARLGGARNPLPAAGGVDPEEAAQVRRRAPQAFRTQERAVTPDDYAEVTQRGAGIQRAAATLRWTGSWHTVFITVDRSGGLPLNPPFEDALTRQVERYRMAGHDLEFDNPVYVSLEIDMLVCVAADYFRSDVYAALLEVLSNRRLPDGRTGLFHPDNFSFGQTVYLSPLYAAARTVPGVASVQITRLQRQGEDDTRFLADGFMELGRLEIARLDNDPNFPEHGVLRLTLRGGK